MDGGQAFLVTVVETTLTLTKLLIHILYTAKTQDEVLYEDLIQRIKKEAGLIDTRGGREPVSGSGR